jgi:hypothetical protein
MGNTVVTEWSAIYESSTRISLCFISGGILLDWLSCFVCINASPPCNWIFIGDCRNCSVLFVVRNQNTDFKPYFYVLDSAVIENTKQILYISPWAVSSHNRVCCSATRAVDCIVGCLRRHSSTLVHPSHHPDENMIRLIPSSDTRLNW